MRRSPALTVALALLALGACSDQPEPTGLTPDVPEARMNASSLPTQAQDRARWFDQTSPEVMELPEAVYSFNDAASNQLVYAIDRPGAAARVRAILARQGVPPSAYRIVQSAPMRLMNTSLRTAHRPTKAGIQLQFGQYVCTLGFNVDHSGGRSFITNSHCTNSQGGTEGTEYNQPLTSTHPEVIAVEADDPVYGSRPGCSRGKKCRTSDASRALYDSGTESALGKIAKTTGLNNGSLNVNGEFTIDAQNNTATSFSGEVHKVGRTTGWTSGTVNGTCATVNVSGSNIQLLCQTLVEGLGTVVGGGDSGSPVFQLGTNNSVTLVGILWGGSSAGDLFVFSPLKNIQDELGGVTATVSGDGGGTGDGGGGGGGGGTCVPKGKGNNCK